MKTVRHSCYIVTIRLLKPVCVGIRLISALLGQFVDSKVGSVDNTLYAAVGTPEN